MAYGKRRSKLAKEVSPPQIVQPHRLEVEVVAKVLDFRVTAHLHAFPGVLVQMATDAVDVVKAPFDLVSQWYEMFLDHLVDRAYVEFGIFEEIQQQFQITVTGAPANAVDSAIKRLRAKLRTSSSEADAIEAVRGVGYRFSKLKL